MKKVILLVVSLLVLSACCSYPTGFKQPNSAGSVIFGSGMYP